MANFINRVKYYAASLAKRPFSKYFNCPNCGCKAAELIDRKYLITTLARCPSCEILFRQPTDTKEELNSFYTEGYTTSGTDLPADRSPDTYRNLEILRQHKDFSDYIRVLRAAGCGHGTKLFDYGCSWGYGTAQFRAAGFDVSGYEISPVNRRFAREILGLSMIDSFDDYASETVDPEFDVFFSSHVLEHLPQVTPILKLAQRIVKPGGLLVFFVPNGSTAFMAANRKRWRRLWGEVHPLFLTDKFFVQAFGSTPILIGSSPVSSEIIADYVANPLPVVASLDGKELACIVRLP